MRGEMGEGRGRETEWGGENRSYEGAGAENWNTLRGLSPHIIIVIKLF